MNAKTLSRPAPEPTSAPLPPVYEKLRTAHKRACPIVALSTADPAQSVRRVIDALSNCAVLTWDCARGCLIASPQPNLEKAKEAVSKLAKDEVEGLSLTGFLCAAVKLPKDTAVVIYNAHRFLDFAEVMQSIWNLRDQFKEPRRTLILMGSSIKIPPELQHDVIEIDEPLPDQDTLKGVIERVYETAKIKPEPEVLEDAASACQGLSAFAAEQLAYLNLSKADGVSVRGVWADKCTKINETPGLRVISGGSFENVAGVEQIKRFLSGVLNGRDKPLSIIFVDEIEKSIGGAAGDTSGVSQDQLGVLLQYMQDSKATGAIFVGPPGAAKSALAKTAGGEAGIPTIQFDLGGMKDSLVGGSEARIRDALKVIDSISSGKTLWLATCNSLRVLPPELRRRFRYGCWYFGLPDLAERKAIWDLYCHKYDLPIIPDGDEILSRQWTGAEIESCCEIAWRLYATVAEAAAYIVPVSVAGAQQIEELEAMADGRLLSASLPGVYNRRRSEEYAQAAQGRALDLE